MEDRCSYFYANTFASEVRVLSETSSVLPCLVVAITDAETYLWVHSKLGRSQNDAISQSKIIELNSCVLDSFSGADVTGKMNHDTRFLTDAEIASASKYQQRELLPWSNDTPHPVEEVRCSLTTIEGWDQFEANEKLFGITSDFDEAIYTTTLNKANPLFAEVEAKALLLAKQIESSQSHEIKRSSELSDNAKYSDVLRVKDLKEKISAEVNSSDESKQQRNKTFEGLAANHGSDVVIRQFRQFVHSEKERLERKRKDIVKRDKDVRLQDLRKFSKTFKLNTPVPPDLIPILTKDKTKQAEMVASLKNSFVLDSSSVIIKPIENSTLAKEVRKEPMPLTQGFSTLSTRLKGIQTDRIKTQPQSYASRAHSGGRLGLVRSSNGVQSNRRFADDFKPNPTAVTFTPSAERSISMGSRIWAPDMVRISKVLPNFSLSKRGGSAKPYSTVPTWNNATSLSYTKSSLFEENLNRGPIRYFSDNGLGVFSQMRQFQDADGVQKFHTPFPNPQTQTQHNLFDGSAQQYSSQLYNNYSNRLNTTPGVPGVSFLPQPSPFPLPIYSIYNNSTNVAMNNHTTYSRKSGHQQINSMTYGGPISSVKQI